MNQKKLLVLGGSAFQVPLIEKAKAMGLYVITCDYLPENPGHALADEYHNASTTDKEAVLDVAKTCQIDAITTFCSDPAAPTVAFVAETLNLPGPTLAAVELLTEKDKFRKLMQVAGLNVPACFTVNCGELPHNIDDTQRYIVKPVDSSGSKGITQSAGTHESLSAAIEYALSFSRAGRCIIEEFIDGPQVHGDAFIQGGKIIYHYLGDHFFFTGTNSFIPISTLWPASISVEAMDSVITQVERVVQAAGYTDGPINIEARIDAKGSAYIIEVGPRNGGNFVPIIQQRLSGFDFTQAVIDMALGEQVSCETLAEFNVGAYYILHAEREGILSGVEIPESISSELFYKHLFKEAGNLVKPYTGSNQTIGVCLFEGQSKELHNKLAEAPPKVLIEKV